MKLIYGREKFPVYDVQKLSPLCEKLSYNIYLYHSFSPPLTCFCKMYMSKASNRFRTFPGIWVHLLRTSMHLLMWMVNISSVLLETGAFSFLLLQYLCLGFFGCFVYFSGFSFVSLLRLSMKNKKYK